MRGKILSMVSMVMMLFMAVGCGGAGTATQNSSPTKETQLSVSFKQSVNETFQKANREDVKSVRISISKGSTFYLEAASMTKDAVTGKWGIGVHLDNSLAPFDVVAVARDSVDDSGNILFKTKIGTVIADLTANLPIVLEEVDDTVSPTTLPILKNVTHTTSGNTVSLNFVVQNTHSYALSSESSGTFDTPTGTVSDSTEASFSATYTKGTDESKVNLKVILTNADGSSRTFSFSISENVLTVDFPPEVVVNVEEQLSPANTFKLTATVTDDDSTKWDYTWEKIRGAKVTTLGTKSPNELYIQSISTASPNELYIQSIGTESPNELYIQSISTDNEQYPLCFALTVTDDGGASSSLDYCIKNADNGYVGLKKTGQTKSYDGDGTEITDGSEHDDGFYQKGLTPQYTRDATAQTVIDHVTGLVWQDDANAKTVTKPWLTQNNYNAGNYSNTSGDTATTYCAELSLAGHTDWRLPTRKELHGLVDYGQFNPAINNTFVNTASNYYWSSATHAGNSSYAWIVSFSSGLQLYYGKDVNYYVRCVRAGQ